MKITLIAVGKTSTDYIERGIAEYFKRCNRYMPMELCVIPDVKAAKALSEDSRNSVRVRLSLRLCSRAMWWCFLTSVEKNSRQENFPE